MRRSRVQNSTEIHNFTGKFTRAVSMEIAVTEALWRTLRSRRQTLRGRGVEVIVAQKFIIFLRSLKEYHGNSGKRSGGKRHCGLLRAMEDRH